MSDKCDLFNSNLVVITGTSKGIGKSIALEFMKHGWTVIGCARSKEVTKEMNTKYKNGHFDTIDVSNYLQVKSWVNNMYYIVFYHT